MYVVGLTGGIGSGKSTIASFFADLGVPVYDSDAEAKKLMHSDRVRRALIEEFGEEVFQGKTLNKNWLSQRVFSDPDALERLNGIVHPAVRDHFLEWEKAQSYPYVIQETALIFENNAQGRYQSTLLVVAPEESRIQRVIKRSGWNREQVLARIKAQWADEHKKNLASDILENIDLEVSRKRVKQLHERYLQAATQKHD